MLQVEEALKELYKADSTDKNLILEFYQIGQDEPFLCLFESGNIKMESLEITESLSSSKNLDFGSCEASQVKITLIDVEEQVKDAEMRVYQTLEGLYPAETLIPGVDRYPSGYTMPLGKYIIKSAERQADRKYKDVVGLDGMCRFDVNVVDWYNALPFPLPLRDFRARLCKHIGVVECVPDYLPNDSMLVEKTVDAEQLLGRDALIACEQANGVFGHFDRDGVLQHITLQPNYALIPEANLYPSEDLCHVKPGQMNEQVYDEKITQHLCRSSCRQEEYAVQSIDTVQIRQEEGDIGAIYGSGKNCLTVDGNFLLFGKNAAQLQDIARGIHGMVNGRRYIPYSLELKGLPYIEVGDAELIETIRGNIVSYVIKRTLKGVCALKDTHSATGDETRPEETGINAEIIRIKGKTAVIKKNVDEVSAELTDLAKNTEAKFAVTAEQISAEVKRAQEAEASLKIMADSITTSVKDLQANVQSEIKQMADSIILKVSIGDISNQISIEKDGVNISGGRFSWSSQYSSMTANGKLKCVDGEFSGKVTSTDGKIGGFLIEGDSLRSNGDSSIDFGNVVIDRTGLMAGNWYFSDENISCMDYIIANLNGNVFVYHSAYYNGWAVGKALDDLRNRIGGGGGCGYDGCDDSCDDAGCNDDALVDDIGGC